MKPAGPNAQQIEYWNEVAGPKWVALEDLLDAQIRGLSLEALARTRPERGERVVDVGCGCGGTTLEIAGRVGPSGQVLGVDISGPMLERARARSSEAQLEHVRFEQADAQIHDFEPGAFDLVFSRFGVMFFAEPEVAFANLRGALRPGGRLAFLCWRDIQRNPWMLVPTAAAAAHLELPPPPPPDAPGPFAFADDERVRGILGSAGFEDVGFESLESELAVGGTGSLDDAVDFLLQMGPAAAALRQAESPAVETVRAAVRESVAPYYVEGPEPGVRMSCACWIVTARRP